nr:restriction endonuclease subunit S [Roseibaca domitiana]
MLALIFEHELLKHRDVSIQTTIGEVCTGFEYGTSSKSQPKGKMPVLRMGNLQSGEIDWSDLVYTDSDADIEKLKLIDGDVLFNRTNSLEHVGKTAIYRGDMPAIFAGYLIRVHYDKSNLLPDFLNMFLNSKSARDYGRSISGKSVNQANISASKLKTYPIILPSVRAQEEIVRMMESLRGPLKDLEVTYDVKMQDLDDLRQSLLQKAFAGELT